jgi:hypothetical protein
MRRRGSQDSAINLFSFQDIVCSVIGMVFFVVLIMALDIVETKATGVEGVTRLATEAEVAALRAKAASLRDAVAKAEAGIEEATTRVSLASADEEATLDEVRRLDATLKGLYSRVGQAQDVVAKTDVEKRQLEADQRKKQAELADLVRRAAELKAQLKQAQAAPRVAFIIDPRPDNLEPWLLEISGQRLRVANRDGRGAILEFGGATSTQRKERLLSWIKTQSSRTHYFVLLIKPTGIELSRELEKTLKEQGFEIGVDLLPEDWEPFQG